MLTRRPIGLVRPCLMSLTGCLLLLAAPACRYHPNWPDAPLRVKTAGDAVSRRAYAIDRTGAPNYFQQFEDGRIVAMAFDDDADGRVDETVQLPGEHPDRPHFVIVLDGIPFDVVEAMYAEGHFRLFAPPSRVVSVFPAMTDVALARFFHVDPCVAIEASYYDRRKNALSNGNDVYMSGQNAPWTKNVDYHAPQNVAVGTYTNPWAVFSTELRGMHRLFRRTRRGGAVGYSVGTAGIGTRGGEPAIRALLREVEKLCERITYDRRGRVRFSILADHGHTLVPCGRVSFRKTLTDAGFHVAKSLRRPNDIVIISYGLVTCAQFYTDRPREAADALVTHPAVDLVLFRQDDAVVVRSATARATVRKRSGGFAYDMSAGDPLELAGVLSTLRAAGHLQSDGAIPDRPLFEATADHHYPDALNRIWACFDGQVQKPADVIASLKPGACAGSKFFHFFVAPVASTHGDLGARSSTAFLLTNATPTPPPPSLRIGDVLDVIQGDAHLGSPANASTAFGFSDYSQEACQLPRPRARHK